ncbi:hypothetical protein [Parachryseolinea silvisoli]|uniref:hypothetical protein n=1 Tax=Parachryseolinea silvisoli TaxID=2873601 RepID=UPI0022658DF5|nr:hypothetical protein [Parachryseolinea silvisoli]MCD9015127.1 hypothetical protein [Parachryseolinea silvisoli]
MKRIAFIIGIGLMAVLFEQCIQEDVESTSLQTVQFVLASVDESVKSPVSMLSPGMTAIVTLETASGEPFVADHSLKLVPTGSGYLTEPLRLPPGRYVVSRFVVFGNDSEALFEAPDMVEGTISDAGVKSSAQIVIHLLPCHGGPAGKGRLKEFVFGERHYNLFYNWRGTVDSVVATDVYNNYVYRVAYTRGRIDSVGIYDHGQYVSVNRDFKFNRRGQIVSYNYVFFTPVGPYVQPVNLNYDHRGRIVAVRGASVRYNRFDNVIWFQNGVSSYFTYTYHWGKNPLREVDNLGAMMVEESWIWQYVLSKSSTLSRTNENGDTFTFTNVYDSKGRLISNGEMLFSYY